MSVRARRYTVVIDPSVDGGTWQVRFLTDNGPLATPSFYARTSL